MCNAELALARSNERRGTFPSIAITSWSAANHAIKRPKQAENRSRSSNRHIRLNGQSLSHAVLKCEKRPQMLILCLGKFRHINRRLTIALNRSQRDQQYL
jgi:hypothetical protein